MCTWVHMGAHPYEYPHRYALHFILSGISDSNYQFNRRRWIFQVHMTTDWKMLNLILPVARQGVLINLFEYWKDQNLFSFLKQIARQVRLSKSKKFLIRYEVIKLPLPNPYIFFNTHNIKLKAFNTHSLTYELCMGIGTRIKRSSPLSLINIFDNMG